MVELAPSKAEFQRALEERHGAELQKKFSNSTVAVCGLGGLGSNIAVVLARAGIGKLILIDFDRVDITNLNRQQYKAGQIGCYKTDALSENIAEIAPYITLEAHNVRLSEKNIEVYLKNTDVICEAFDDPECKAMLVNTVLENLPDKYLVAASGMAGLGSANAIRTRRVSGKFYLCGDGESDVTDGTGLISTRVMLCAAHQAHTALRVISGEFEA